MTQASDRAPLSFENDRGSTRSRWVAGAIALAVAAWMGSGYILPAEEDAVEAEAEVAERAVVVAIRRSVAENTQQVFVAEGQALPDRDTIVRAETSGEIAEMLVTKGADVTGGEVIARFDVAGRQADVTRAEEELTRAQREFDNASALLDRGVATVDRVAEARAILAAAEAAVTDARNALGDIEITAPFDGRLEELDIDAGEFVSTGADIARIVDNTPLTIRVQIPQQALADIRVGQASDVSFITGETGTGTVTFVGTSADAETRTFTAEITVENDGRTIPAGVSARVRIPTGELRAHFVSPAILSLDTDGTLGIKTVGDDDRIVFHEIAIVRAQTDGIWVSGLPDEARIVTVGQGFVNDGEIVDPRPEDAGEGGETRVSAGIPDPTSDAAEAGDDTLIATERDLDAGRDE